MRTMWVVVLCTALAGCGRSMAEIENADDATCRQAIAQRAGPQPPDAYAICRANVMSVRRDRAVASSGTTIVQSGPPHHWSLD